ncbi:hypothetical protein EJ08DRAFT_50902 [Tothia fuscella]|uniref:Uncharacterized protein n=1 Tax=Tothia fuscella TaxID=1048955 RepID=A0A9P4TT77_9PEZI|nr:hypothetical protein EJ08DRAFT_50902 [Tothia fuscella]
MPSAKGLACDGVRVRTSAAINNNDIRCDTPAEEEWNLVTAPLQNGPQLTALPINDTPATTVPAWGYAGILSAGGWQADVNGSRCPDRESDSWAATGQYLHFSKRGESLLPVGDVARAAQIPGGWVQITGRSNVRDKNSLDLLQRGSLRFGIQFQTSCS